MEAENRQLREQILILTQQLDHLKRQLFGRRSERFDHPELFEGDMPGKPEDLQESGDEPEEDGSNGNGAAPENANKRKRARPVRAARLPANLPVREEIVTPAAVLADPEMWRRVGEDTVERLGKEPGHFYISRYIYEKYVRRDELSLPPLAAPAPPRMIGNGFWEPDLVAEVISNRYLYHLPYYRQQQLFAQRWGVDLPANTMSDAARHVGGQCAILVARMRELMLASGAIQADETTVTYLDPSADGGSSTGYFWVYRGLTTGDVVFDWRTTREHKHLADWLGPFFRGVLQSDGYDAYRGYCAAQTLRDIDLRRAACLAHIRRKFENARNQRPEVVAWILKIIAKLYLIEENLRQAGADPPARVRARERSAERLIRLLRRAVDHLLTRPILPKSDLGIALRYALGQLPAMETYLHDGRVEIDNNLIENAIRPSAVGKKNWLFVGGPEAGDRSAVIYSLLISARAHGVDPEAYLRDVIEKLPGRKAGDIDDLLPGVWADAHRSEHPASEPNRPRRSA